MPIAVTEKNLKKVFSEHLKNGETIKALTLAGARGSLGITSEGRIYQTNFPFWGKSKIIEEYKLSDITTCDSQQKNSYTLLLSLIVNGEEKSYKATITPLINTIDNVANFVKYVQSTNINTKPDYLDDDEEVLDTIHTKNNAWKVTNKNIIKLTTKRELVEKISLSNLKVLDFYPGKMSAVFLYFETQQGDKELLKISGSVIFMSNLSGVDPFEVIDKIYDLIKAQGENPYPPYIHDDETILATIRAGHSIMGLANPAHVLKLTNRRLIDLKPQKEGNLKIDKVIDLSEIKSAKFIKVRGESTDYYELKIKMNDKEKHKFVMDYKYKYSINKIKEQIDKIDSE